MSIMEPVKWRRSSGRKEPRAIDRRNVLLTGTLAEGVVPFLECYKSTKKLPEDEMLLCHGVNLLT